jgi:hypothetical protein
MVLAAVAVELVVQHRADPVVRWHRLGFEVLATLREMLRRTLISG